MLTIKDQSKEIGMPIEFSLSEDLKKLDIKISTTISRKYFELDFGPMNALIGDGVQVEVNIVADIQ